MLFINPSSLFASFFTSTSAHSIFEKLSQQSLIYWPRLRHAVGLMISLSATMSLACPGSIRSTGILSLEPTLEVPHNWQAGVPFKVVDVAMSDAHYQCTLYNRPTPSSSHTRLTRRANGTTFSSIGGSNGICETSVPGIGLRIERISGTLAGEAGEGNFASNTSNICNITNTVAASPTGSLSSYLDSKGVIYRVSFYKTGPIATGATLPAGENVFSYSSNSVTGDIGVAITYANSSTIITAPPNCILQTNGALRIEMGDVEAARIRNGSAPQIPFVIPINCEARVNAKLQVDLPPGKAEFPGVIPLVEMSKTAKGVGIALYQGGTMVQPGQVFSISTLQSNGGMINIPFTARYYAVDNKVSAGSAYGNATFTLIMQ